MDRLRRIAPLLGALAIALALAACGGGKKETAGTTQATETTPAETAATETTEHVSAVAAAAEKTTKVGSARFSLTMNVTGLSAQTGAETATLQGEGAFDYHARRGRMTLDLGELGAALGAAGATGVGQVELIFDGTTFYMKLAELSQLIPGAKPWLKLDLEALGKQEGVNLGQLQQLSQGDPTQALSYLRAAGEFAKVGTELVRGVETTHYKGTLDLDEVAAKLPADQRKSVEDVISQAGLARIPAEAWIDGDGLLRKMTLVYAGVPGQGQAQGKASLTLTIELFDFGSKVEIKPPPADQVSDLGELLKSFGQGVGGATTPTSTGQGS